MKIFITFLVIALICVGSIYSQSIDDSLVFYYPCNGDLTDYSGNGLNASSNGILTEDENGEQNSAYDLNGIDQYIDIPYSPLYRVDFPATFRMKFKVDSFPSISHTFLFANDFVSNVYYGLEIVLTITRKISLNYGNGSGIGPYSRISKMIDDTLSTGVWYELVAIWHNEDDLCVYIDCEYKAGLNSGYGDSLVYSVPPFNNAVVGVGDSHISYPPVYFNGQVDEISFWNRALEIREIIDLCDEEVAVNIPEQHPGKTDGEIVKRVYPNPFSDYTTFELNLENVQGFLLSLYNIDGQLVRQFPISSSRFTLKRGELTSGLYFFRIENNEQSLIDRGKLVVK